VGIISMTLIFKLPLEFSIELNLFHTVSMNSKKLFFRLLLILETDFLSSNKIPRLLFVIEHYFEFFFTDVAISLNKIKEYGLHLCYCKAPFHLLFSNLEVLINQLNDHNNYSYLLSEFRVRILVIQNLWLS